MATLNTHRAFPFCQVTSGSVPATISAPDSEMPYGLATNYERLFGWMWRVREWTFAWAATIDQTESVTEEEVTTELQHLTFEGSGSMVTDDYASFTEKHLNCATRWTVSNPNPFSLRDPDSGRSWTASQTVAGALDWNDNIGNSITGGDMVVTIQLDLFQPQGAQKVRWKRTDAGLWVPAISCVVLLQSPDYPYPSAYVEPWVTVFDGVDLMDDALPLPSGYPVPCGFAGTADFALTITPASYFEYDPGDGDGPIWNGVTGEPERDPVTLVPL